MGCALPLGRDHGQVLAALEAGSRAGLVEREDLMPGRTVIVGAVPGELPELPAHCRHLDCRNNRLMLAALEPIMDAVARTAARFGRERVAVVLGTSTSGIAEGERALRIYRATNAWPPEGYAYRQQETGNLAEFAALALGLAGPAYTVATACSSSAKVFASARRLIRAGLADAAVVGGADTLCRMTLGGFGALEALSATACNPLSANRDGITIGEGAAAFLMEKGDGPVRLLGVGESSDAHHVSAPDPEGKGAASAMRAALSDAGLGPADIGYVNLHGTATRLNDAMESKAVAKVLGTKVPVSSTKALTGHMLGAAGAGEAALLWLTLSRGRMLPPHVWDGAFDPELPRLNVVAPNTPIPAGAMLSNSFAFGGSNAALVLGRP
jgi:3-oxoacyl-[acyl-carrier-protein] synthase-1